VDKRDALSMSRRFSMRLLAVVMLAFPCATACGGGTPEPKVAAADKDTAKVVFLLSESGPVPGAIQARLQQLGYQVVADSAAAHDLVVSVRTHNQQNQSFFKVVVNGRERVSFTTHVNVQLALDGVTLASSHAEFPSDETIDSGQLEKLVAAITEKYMLAKVAREAHQRKVAAAGAAERKKRDEEARKQQEKENARMMALKEDESAWAQVVVAECTSARDAHSCDKVKAYLAKFPTGNHAAEARAAAETGTAALVKVQDERDWNEANVGDCRKPKVSIGCDGVKKYLDTHPTGAHAAEARDAASAAQVQLEKLAKAEERAAEREAKKAEEEEKKAAREACLDACKDACVNWRAGHGVRMPCYNRCVQRDCN